MITQLKNPQSNMYCDFKRAVKGGDFNWNYISPSYEGATPGMLSHTFIKRPGDIKYPVCEGVGVNFAHDVVTEILESNDIILNCIYRININMVFPQAGKQQTPVHTDHPFPHHNMIVYFSNGGKTIIENDEHDPKEDDVIIFPGVPHCHELPKDDMRIVLVATYLSGYDDTKGGVIDER